MNEAYKLAQQAFKLVGATNFLELHKRYSAADQALIKLGMWDAKCMDLVINQIKILLEQMDPAELEEEDRYWRRQTLWFWYHHAVGWALQEWPKNEFAKVLAQAFSSMALSLQTPDHPNKITRLFFYLVHNDIETAKKWWSTHPSVDEEEHRSGVSLLDLYDRGRFFYKVIH